MSISLKNILTPQPKSKIKAGNGMKKGTYKFFTSSKSQLKFIDDFQYDKEALIFGTGGNANIHYCNEPFGTSTDCIVMYTNKNVNLKFLYYYISGNMYLLQNGFKGSGLKHISKDYILNISINLPDKKTQDIIVNRFDLLIDIIDKLNKKITYFDQLVKAKFIEMFGDLYVGTCKYSTNKLKNLSIKISDGIHSKPEYTSSGKPFLSVVNISKKRIDFTDCKYVSEEAYKKMIKSTHPEKGDILYTKVGTYGIPAYVDTDVEFCLYVSVCLIKPNHNLINSKFLALQMDMPFIKYQADRRIRGIGVPDLHLNQIAEFDLLCPPRYLQDKFVNFVNNVEKSKSTVKKCLEKAELLKSALTQEYFN